MRSRLYEKKQIDLGHEAQIKSPEDLVEGLGIIVCNVIPEISLGQRSGQALMGTILGKRDPGVSRRSAAKEGWRFTPESGLWLSHQGTVKWINQQYRYCSVFVSHQRPDSSNQDGGYLIVDNPTAVLDVTDELPPVDAAIDRRQKLSSLGLEPATWPTFPQDGQKPQTGWQRVVTLSVPALQAASSVPTPG